MINKGKFNGERINYKTKMGMENNSPFHLNSKVNQKERENNLNENRQSVFFSKYSDNRQPSRNFKLRDTFFTGRGIESKNAKGYEGSYFTKTSNDSKIFNSEYNKNGGCKIGKNMSESTNYSIQTQLNTNYSNFGDAFYIPKSQTNNINFINKVSSTILEEIPTYSNTLSSLGSQNNSNSISKSSSSSKILQIDNMNIETVDQDNYINEEENYENEEKFSSYQEPLDISTSHNFQINASSQENSFNNIPFLRTSNPNTNSLKNFRSENNVMNGGFSLNFSKSYPNLENNNFNNYWSNNSYFGGFPQNVTYSPNLNNTPNLLHSASYNPIIDSDSRLSPFCQYQNKFNFSNNFNSTATTSTCSSAKEENYLLNISPRKFVNKHERKSLTNSSNGINLFNLRNSGTSNTNLRKSFQYSDTEYTDVNSADTTCKNLFSHKKNFIKINYNKFNLSQNLPISKCENTEILTVKIQDKNSSDHILSIHRYDNVFNTVKNYCDSKNIAEDCIKPIVMKINESLRSIYNVYNSQVSNTDQEYLNSLNILCQEKSKTKEDKRISHPELETSTDLDITSISNISLYEDEILEEEAQDSFFKLNKSF